MPGLRESLVVGYRGNRSQGQIPGSAPAMPMPMVLTLDQLSSYDRNPRRAVNPMFDDLKASIRERGLDNPLSVTQRPGDEGYIVEAGGNTRLAILNELWKETKLERFWRVDVNFKPWRGELHVLSAHMAENILHADMCFADKAKGIHAIKAEIEREEGAEISWADTERRLQILGLPISHAQVARMRYLNEVLATVAPDELMMSIGPYHVDKLQEAINACASCWDGEAGDTDGFLAAYSDALKEILLDSPSDVPAAVRGIQSLADELRAERHSGEEPGAETTLTHARECTDDLSSMDNGADEETPEGPEKTDSHSEEANAVEPGASRALGSMSEVDSEESREVPEPVRKLQQIVNLRSRCYVLVRAMLEDIDDADSILVPADSGFGFDIHMRGKPSCPELWFLCTIAGASGADTDAGIPVHAWGAMSPGKADAGFTLLRYIREIMQLCKQTEDDTGVSTPWQLHNRLLMAVQDRLDPVTAEASRLIPEFIKHEASAAMMVSLFDGMTVTEVQLLRVELGITTNGGRPIKPLPFEANRLWDKWLDLELNASDISERERYLVVAKDVELPLSTVWNEIRSRVHKGALEDDDDNDI